MGAKNQANAGASLKKCRESRKDTKNGARGTGP